MKVVDYNVKESLINTCLNKKLEGKLGNTYD